MAVQDNSSEAAAWVARLDRFGDRPDVRAEFERWLAQDKRREGAILRAEMAWVMLDRAQALHGIEPDVKFAGPSRRALIGGGVAAAAAIGGVAFWRLQESPQTYRAGPGEFRRFQLKDGSTIALNTDSEMQIAIAARTRAARLARGQAWLQVSADGQRPFLMHVSDLSMRVENSTFAVSRNADTVDVMVTEGALQIHSLGRLHPPMILAAGTRAVLESTGQFSLAKVSRQDMERALAWREGRIALAGESLAEAVQTFNRYNARKLVVTDSGLASAKLDGWFSLDDPVAFARAAAESLNAQVDVEANRIVLTVKIPTSAT